MVSKLALFCASITTAAAVEADDVLLTRTPMIMTHDAATGYLGGGLVNAWAKTQSKSFAGQLDCGARAFDLRPTLDSKNGLIWHHGDVPIKHLVSDSLSEIIDWCNANPSELVVLPFSDYGGTGCEDAVKDALAAAKITNLESCDSLDGLTYGAAKTMGALPGGGALLALTGGSHPSGTACSYGNYDPTQSCVDSPGESEESTLQSNGTISLSAVFDCWKGSGSASQPVDRLLTYLDGVSAGGLSDGAFTQFQAIWQEDSRTVVRGTARGSSILKDDNKSDLHSIILDAVQTGRWPEINMLEVNDVCDGGLDLMAALRSMQTQQISV